MTPAKRDYWFEDATEFYRFATYVFLAFALLFAIWTVTPWFPEWLRR